MHFEDLRSIQEDLERLEAAIADRCLEEPRHIRDRLVRDHEVATYLSRMEGQSQEALTKYRDDSGVKQQELQAIGTGDVMDEFFKRLAEIKDFHKRYPNSPVENLERVYKRQPGDDHESVMLRYVDNLFTGEEAFGRFFDLTMLHEEYLNLPGVRLARRITYLQYLDLFDKFTPPACPVSRGDKMTDQYFQYVGSLAKYLEDFMRKTKPLEDLDKLFGVYEQEFEQLWKEDNVPGWSEEKPANGGASVNGGPITEGSGEGVWCADCEKEFKNENVYKGHLSGKKHIKNAEDRKQRATQGEANGDVEMTNGAGTNGARTHPVQRLKEKAVADRENRIRKLAAAMSTEHADTRVNVERKAGMTDKERQQELAMLYASDPTGTSGLNDDDEDEEDDGPEKIYNPLKLPLSWDGKPIPFWLYKLHGLGVEFPCEICGNFVYMGRRAFDKHFSESRHIYGLKCLGVTNPSLFREITRIEEAERLWNKVLHDRSVELRRRTDVVEMEDRQGNVMPEKVWKDLEMAGLL